MIVREHGIRCLEPVFDAAVGFTHASSHDFAGEHVSVARLERLQRRAPGDGVGFPALLHSFVAFFSGGGTTGASDVKGLSR